MNLNPGVGAAGWSIHNCAWGSQSLCYSAPHHPILFGSGRRVAGGSHDITALAVLQRTHREDESRRMQGLTLPSLRIHQHSTGSFPSRQRVVVRWNFAFSLAAAFAFFCALRPWQMPMVVGIADTTRRPMTMMELFGRWVGSV